MVKRRKATKARFVQALVYTDEPHLILLRTTGTSIIVAVAVNAERYEMPYFGVEISKDQFIEFLREKFDLRYLFKRPKHKSWYLFDLASAEDDIVHIFKSDCGVHEEKMFFPGPGIFARELTEEVDGELFQQQDTEKFLIDGKWDLPEFSQFYGNYTDVYVMLNCVDVFLDEQETKDRRRKVQQALINPWQGGGSYGSAYDKLLAVQDAGDRLHVDAIQYASPGFVDVRGQAKTFEKARELIRHFSSNSEEISKEYKEFHKFLSEVNLLKMAAAEFTKTGDIAEEVSERAKKFAELLGAVPYEVLYQISGNDQLIVAKVLLSIHRRLAKLYQFFLEGRVTFNDIEEPLLQDA